MNKLKLIISILSITQLQSASTKTQKIFVSMSEQKEISYLPKDSTTQEIYTGGLNGCTAIAAFIECTDPEKDPSSIMLNHYSPVTTDRMQQIAGLTNFKKCACPHSQIKKTKMIILSTWDTSRKTEYDASLFNTKSINGPIDDKYILQIERIMGIKALVIPYYETCQPWYKDPKKIFSIKVENGRIFYQSLADNYVVHELDK